MDYVALKAELTNDPLGRGYNTPGNEMDDEQAAKSLAVADREINRETITGGQLVSCIVKSEYIALTNNEKDWIRLLAATATPITVTPTLRTDLGSTFPAGSATRASLVAMVKRLGTRAEELNLGGQPTTSDVAKARQLP